MDQRDRPHTAEARPYADFDYPLAVAREGSQARWAAGSGGFRVEEIPLYAFSGEGEHAVVTVEKADRTTRDVAVAVARRLGVPNAGVGYAGMKDKNCVSVQSFTVSGVGEAAAAAAFEDEGCRVLFQGRHRNKLRLGHLAGNRFRVLLLGCSGSEARSAFDALEGPGVPNFFGPQRFGARGDNAAAGLRVLKGALRTDRWKRDLFVSALQSAVFNEVLARRLEAGTLASALAGDVLRREDSGGLFVCEDPEADQPRVSAFEVTPTGPIPGKKMVRPQGGVAAKEAAVLEEMGVDVALFSRETGSRRPLRVPLSDCCVEEGEGGCRVSFALPAGAYATSVIREITGGSLERR